MREHRHMEHDVVARFSAEVERRFYELHTDGATLPYTVGTALSGQDTDLADYLLAARGRFALIEFKADRPSVLTELGKVARQRLLEKCRDDTGTLRRSQNIHHVAWEKLEERVFPQLGNQLEATIEIARYIPEIAAAANLQVPLARARTWSSTDFIASYLQTETAGSNVRRFRRYLSELYEIAGKNGATEFGRFQGAVLVFVPSSSGESKILSLRFSNFDNLMELTIEHDRALRRQRDHHREGKIQERGLSR